jgi:NADH-quinone oxidoreductase subunit J
MSQTQILFYIFGALLIVAAFAVISSRNPVQGVLCLVSAFVLSACIWLLLQAEFLGLVLILVYVGAVMTLFLFVVMMMNLDKLPSREGFKKYWPFGLIIFAMIVGLMIYVLPLAHFPLVANSATITYTSHMSNVTMLGNVLYTHYVFAFELAAVILLVAIIAAISLAFKGWSGFSKRQDIQKQVQTRASERIRLVKDLK